MSQTPFRPEGAPTLTPYMRIKGAAKAMAFYKEVWQAEEVMCLTQPDGNIAHAQLRICGSLLMLADEYPDANILGPISLGGTTFAVHLYVDDVDTWFNRAVDAGAEVVFPLQDQFYGERSGRLRDPFGHEWLLSTMKEELTPEEMQRRFDEMMK